MTIASPRTQPHQSHCSQQPLSPPTTIEEGIRIIESILKKDVLCRHDVENINQAYQKMGQRHIEQILVDKIKEITSSDPISPADLITLFYLQDFLDKALAINDCFKTVFSRFNRTSESIEAVASLLPCCSSEAHFDQDAATLIGSSPGSQVDKILHRKKEQLQKQEVEKRKSVLTELRKKEPENYPAYLDELLDSRYMRLYDHLMLMKALSTRLDRATENEKIAFSQLSHVVLETREAIIRKVESSIPAGCHDVLFLIGGTGAGKSTTLSFLLGEVMELKDYHYVSHGEKGHLIGQSPTASCTFTPNIGRVNDRIIVDFSGFLDTNGQPILLGMELALIALLRKFQPKILVLESITNTHSGYISIAQLGWHLSRLLEKKERCVLGFTKYSEDVNFFEVRILQERQKRERQQELAGKEKILLRVIEGISSLNMPELQPAILEKKQELEKLQQANQQLLQQPLSDTDEIIRYKAKIQEVESEILAQCGLTRKISFFDLENPSQLPACLAELANMEPVSANPTPKLAVEDEAFLEGRFKKDLLKLTEAERAYPAELRDFSTFKRRVLESSLIRTIFSLSNPEIGQFLHLPEIDPTIVRKFDKELIESSIENYTYFIIRTLDVALIDKITGLLTVATLKTKIELFQEYILGTLGGEYKDPAKREKNWADLRSIAFRNAPKEKFKLPSWVQFSMGTSTEMPHLLKLNQAQTEESLTQCCIELDQALETLNKLHELKYIAPK